MKRKGPDEVLVCLSPCPNDTFIFHALLHGRIDCGGFRLSSRFEDVETLNRLAVERVPDICKVSCHALALIRDHYYVLTAGAALGRGCGPLVVAREELSLSDLEGKVVALPGALTTAALLFGLALPHPVRTVQFPFHEIIPAIGKGEVDAGVIIHESRFTYQSQGLKRVIDLGEWWETETGRPVPLGCIVARRSLGRERVSLWDRLVRESILYARAHPSESLPFIRAHSKEMSDEVCAAHIDLYVNDFSADLGEEGKAAIVRLLDMTEEAGLVASSAEDIFVG